MFQDWRFGLRMLLKQPGFTLIAVLTLALGMGAGRVIYRASVVRALFSFLYSNAARPVFRVLFPV